MVSVVDIIHRFLLFIVSVVVFVDGFRRRRKHFVWFPSLVFVKWFPSWQENIFCMVSVAGVLLDSAAAGGSTTLECIERFLVVFLCF